MVHSVSVRLITAQMAASDIGGCGRGEERRGWHER